MNPNMRWHSLSVFVVALVPLQALAVTFDCSDLHVDGAKYDLSPLKGRKAVHWQRWTPPSITNTTYTLDLCANLERDNKVAKGDQCPSSTRVCSIETDYNLADGTNTTHEVIPIAGQFGMETGKELDPNITRFGGDSKKEGLLIKLYGGRWPDDKNGRKQSAEIKIICDHNKTGNEGFTESAPRRLQPVARDDDESPKEPELPKLDEGKSLQFESYGPEGDYNVLKLTWESEYACTTVTNNPPPAKPSTGWGFFTWLLIIVFLSVASYIIFGSWLNYNRYGARGWDLVPHGDLIRDLPYLMRDWASNLNDRIRGGGGLRGGYSAV